MSDFVYKALRPDGSVVEGTVSARNRTDANRRLAHSGMQPFELGESTAAVKGASPSRKAKSSRAQRAPDRDGTQVRLKPAQVIFFTEELSDLLSAGVQLEQALRMMEGRGAEGAVRNVTARVRGKVRDGMSLSRALETASPSFGPLFCNLVAAGEAGGALPAILRRQIHHLTTLQELRAKVLTALIYPVFLLVSGLVVTVLFVSFLIPRMTRLIESSGGDVPVMVRLLIDGTEIFQQWWWLFLLGPVLGVAGFIALIRDPERRLGWDRFILRLPLYGQLLRRRFHVQFLETLSNLLVNGLPLTRSLQLCEGSAQNLHLQRQMAEVSAQVADGASLHRSLEKTGVFPTSLLDMIRIGEHTGQLTESLAKAGTRLDRDLNRSVERISACIQPVIIVAMACVVGTMAYLMITVIYDTISILRSR